jgi:hypothetical protein
MTKKLAHAIHGSWKSANRFGTCTDTLSVHGTRVRKMNTRWFQFVEGALSALLITGFCGPAHVSATIITVPPTDWFFQNTDPRTATNFDVLTIGINPPRIDPMGSSGGAAFPNAMFLLPPNPGSSTSASYNGPPGLPSGGLYFHQFVGWPAGQQFIVEFTYGTAGQPDFDVEDPGRVFQCTEGVCVQNLALSPAGPLFPPPDIQPILNPPSRTSAVAEPSALNLLAAAIVALLLTSRRKRIK